MEKTQKDVRVTPKDDMTNRIHPELRNAFLMRTRGLITADNIETARNNIINMIRQMTAHLPKVEGIKTTTRTIPGLPNEPEVEISIYQPINAKPGKPGLLSIHGGGLIMGSVFGEEIGNIHFANNFQCTVVSPEYRLAPEHPYPAALNDCYATLKWFAANAESLGVDPKRIIVSGGSAGGTLSAALAIKSRDENGPAIAAQFLAYPMLDCRNTTVSSREITDTRIWDRQQNIEAWKMYLGNISPEKATPLASPALLENFEGLPPAYISVGTMDVFRDESIQYASNLLAADVDVELHVYPGVFHGADGMVPTAGIIIKMQEDRGKAMANLLHKGFF